MSIADYRAAVIPLLHHSTIYSVEDPGLVSGSEHCESKDSILPICRGVSVIPPWLQQRPLSKIPGLSRGGRPEEGRPETPIPQEIGALFSLLALWN